jgi:hypothetical protein
VEALLPPGIDRTDAAGEADFTSPARILFGENERTTGGSGDFMIVDAGSLQGMQPGFRFAIYRDVHQAGIPLALVGEAVAVRVEEKTTVVRITNARDAVQAGDFVARRAQSGR